MGVSGYKHWRSQRVCWISASLCDTQPGTHHYRGTRFWSHCQNIMFARNGPVKSSPSPLSQCWLISSTHTYILIVMIPDCQRWKWGLGVQMRLWLQKFVPLRQACLFISFCDIQAPIHHGHKHLASRDRHEASLHVHSVANSCPSGFEGPAKTQGTTKVVNSSPTD